MKRAIIASRIVKKKAKRIYFFEPIQAAAGLTKTLCNMPRRIGMARNRK
jgi:hypothetical protein